MGSCRYRSLIEGLYIPYGSLMEALYTLNSPPVVSFQLLFFTVGVPRPSAHFHVWRARSIEKVDKGGFAFRV